MLGTHQVGVNIESVGTAAATIAARVIAGSDVLAGVEGGHHGVPVALEGVILGAEVVVDEVCIAIVVATY